jgi:hemolysin III
MIQRPQSIDEEIANSVSHGLALLAAIVASTFLITKSQHLGGANVVGSSIFAVTMVLLYLTSTLYHALPIGRAKQALLKFDHGAIYFFIAGSYSPFALGALSGPWNWTILSVVWALAIVGAMLKAFDKLSHPRLSTGLYLLMGCLVLIAAIPLIKNLPLFRIAVLVAGGLAYTGGVIFFVLDSSLNTPILYGKALSSLDRVVTSTRYLITLLEVLK